MSVRIMSMVWSGFPGSGSELLVCLALADWSDDDGRCWPSMTAIAKKCRLSRSQAIRVTHHLIDRGLLVVEGNAHGGAPGSTKRYRIVGERMTGSADATGSVDATGSTDATRRVAPMRQTGSAHATQTISTHQVNRQKASRPGTKPKFDAQTYLAEQGIFDDLIDSWIELRRAKKAPVTKVAMDGIEREAAKAGISLCDALRMCCERGWQGFNADWLQSKQPGSPQGSDLFKGGI